ncbi:type II secretion system secretin GspD [Microvirga aerilata]|uniref:Type II secretion system secretin GspD n=1 Tax=Microvirga aerilata TaxID=670292 RepID=A0A936Z8K1_9HYPH|nr:type II secretion system secretin GspD [Microvirga aerilata]MBL0406278.1 type II secretion system secretin GspD [Microvirga aerilata]
MRVFEACAILRAWVRRDFPAVVAVVAAISLVACQSAEPMRGIGSPLRPAADDGKHRPFGLYAMLSDPTGPAPAERSRSQLGTGLFTGEPRVANASLTAGRSDNGGSYTLNLVDASVTEAASAVLGDVFGVNYTVDPKVDSRITLQTTKPVDRAGIAELFESSLRTIGAAVVKNGNVYRVVTADQAAMGAGSGADIGGQPIGNVTRVVPLRYVAATEMQRILEPIAPFGGVARVDGSRNALLLSGTAQEIATMEETVSVFDVNVMKGMSFAVVPMRGVDPDAIVEDLNKMFGVGADSPMQGMVQFIPNARLKSMLVVSKQPHYLQEAQVWVRRLDEQAIGPERQFYTYVLRNRQAKELVEVLNSIFAGNGDAEQGVQPLPQIQRAAVRTASADNSQVETGVAPPDRFALISASGAAPKTFEPFSNVPLGAGGGDSAAFGTGGAGGARIKVVADSSQNALLILATHTDYKRIERIIANLDIIPNQVLIEATIAEVTLNDDLKFGVRWFLQNKSGSRSGSFTDLISGAVGAAHPGFSFIAKAAGGQVTLSALNQIGNVRVLASPSLMVLDKKTATLQIGDQVPVITQSAVSVATPGAPVVNSVSYKDTGVILSITPRINESGRVLLDIEQEVSTVQRTTTSGIDSPSFGQRRVKTSVVVNDGEGITLGGLIHDRATDVATQVPVLGDIPIFGKAFQHKDNVIEKTELVIILTPRVVRDLNEARAVTDEYRRKVESFVPSRDPGRRLINNVKRVLE